MSRVMYAEGQLILLRKWRVEYREAGRDLTWIDGEIARWEGIRAGAQRVEELDRMAMNGKEILAKWRAKREAIGQQILLARQKAQDDSLPAEHRTNQAALAEELTRRYRQVEAAGQQEHRAWVEATSRQVEASLLSGPQRDAASEARATRQAQEVRDLADQWRDQGRSAVQNNLLAPARHAFNVGALDRARVLMDAAKRLRVEDPILEQSLVQAETQADPHKRRAFDQKVRLIREGQAATIEVWKDRVAYRAGSGPDLARDSSLATLAEFKVRQSEQALKAQGIEVPEEGD